MGKVMSIISRKVNRFNVENRAHRILDRDKPTPAPKYESTIKDIERAMNEDPDFLVKQGIKNKELDERLKQVYVTSKDSYIDLKKNDPNRPLPLDRSAIDDYEFGFKEPEKVPIGRCTLRQAMQFISDHENDPQTWSIEKISKEYKLKESNVEKVLAYFKTFQIYLPEEKIKKGNILTQTKSKLLGDQNQKGET